ncbi:extracellular solute-binding protein [Metabacillus sp. Hm71]|uniref:extracellular solute-binding protein n=1 Tax=Metabacillus sp. Hm71 TaxID=3450743 RepID=UPI003F43EF0E
MLRLLMILLLFLLSLISGCGSQTIIDDRHPTMTFEEKAPIQIEIWHTYSEEETRIFENELIPLFEQKYPEIDVKPLRQSYNEQLKSALISRASVNRKPDIIRMDITWVPKFAELQLLYPVSQFADFKKVKERFYEAPLESNLYEQKYYGLPLNTNTKSAIYNKQLLKDAGLLTPPKTMDELIQVVKEHNLKIGMTHISSWGSLSYFYGLGGRLTDPSYSRASGFLDSRESIQAIKRLVELFKNSYLPPQIVSGYPETWQSVRSGNYFMIDDGPWFYSVHSLEEISLINEQTVSAPFPSNGGPSSILGGENIVMTKGTKHPEAAWTFIKWMTTETPQKALLQAGLLPTNRLVEISSIIKQYPYYKSYIDSIDQTFLRPPVAEWDKIDEVYYNYIRLIFTQKISVEEGLKKAASEIDQLLKAKKKDNGI